jgi:hypothetical protein
LEDSWIESNNAEHIFLSKKFEELCPFFISIGMTHEQFWYEDLTIAKMYLKAYRIKQEREIEMDQWHMWKQGMYIYEALCDVSPVLHAFSKSGTKPLPYPEVPYGMDRYKEQIEKKEPTKQEVENERLKAQVFFDNWARATTKQFENKR